MYNIELLTIFFPAVMIGLLVSIVHAPFGIEVLKRGIIFIDIAVAQIACLGLISANILFYEPSLWIKQLFALLFAILSGLFFNYIEKAIPKYQEAIIGISFVLASVLLILFLSNHAHGNEIHQNILSGQILFVTWSDIIFHAPIYFLIFLIWFKYKSAREGNGFYLLFTLAVTSSVQLVGIYVVFASLVLPALAVSNLNNPYKIAYFCGIISIMTGMISALILDLTAGPLIVISYVIICFLAYFYLNFKYKNYK